MNPYFWDNIRQLWKASAPFRYSLALAAICVLVLLLKGGPAHPPN